MKSINIPIRYKMLVMLIIFSFIQAIIWAQDNTQSTTTTSTHVRVSNQPNEWYTSPWVWVVGGAIFVLLLVAFTRGNKGTGNSHTNKVTVTKTVRKDTDGDVA